jgi:radical SAM protein with 4Fe4S-binding SPASM domain
MTDPSPPLPRSLQVEVTAACNLSCRMCLVRYRPPVDRVTGTMGLDAFCRLVDDLPTLERVTLQGLGEPLLVPHLDDMVAYAAERGIDTGFNTNGTLLTPARAERLVRAGLAWLHISVDGATAETYESIRDGARFERVRQGVAAIVEAKRRLGSGRPDVRIVFVAMRRNHQELVALVRLAAQWGVEKVWVQNLSHSFSDTEFAGIDAEYAPIREFTAAEALWAEETAAEASFVAAREAAARLGVELRLPRLDEPPAPPRPPGTPGCTWPFESAYVTHDGAVQPCCMVMGVERAVLARLDDGPFPELWRGDGYTRFRQALLSGDPPDVCQGCSLYRGVF